MRKILKPEKIIEIVADYYGTTPEKMLSNNRKRENVLPRQVAMYMMRYNSRLALNRIGEIMQGKRPLPFDHTTVIHSIRIVFDMMETDEAFDRDMQNVQDNIVEAMRGSRTRKPMIVKPVEVKPIARVVDMSEHEKLIAKYV